MENNSFTEGNILKSLVKFAFPVLGALFLQALYGAVDLLVVGKFATIADQSGVATGSLFTTTFGGIISAFAIAITILVGESFGEQNFEKAKMNIGTGVIIFFVIAIVSSLVIIPSSKYIATLMQSPSEALGQTTDYIKVCGCGFFFIIFFNVISAIFRGMGDSKTPLLIVLVACIINIIGDLILVIGFNMGAKGAALATVLAQGVSVVIALFLIMSNKTQLEISISELKFNIHSAKRIVTIGLPAAIQELLVGFSFIFVQSTVNTLGVVQSGGVGIADKICAFLMLVSSSYMQSMAAFTAQNNGAGKHERAKQGLIIGITTASIVGAITALLAFFAGDKIGTIFANDIKIIEASHSILKAYAFDCFLTAILFCFMGYFNGNEHTFFVMVQGLFGAFFVRIPLVILFNNLSKGSLFFIGLATPCSSVIQIIMCIVAYFIYEKKHS
ncbi:MAG: MATE family efflux transporter [Sphaerochaetaceae bacterium]|nr:MATE family efflux transporter [Sphaerochaetaceae bacterium]